MDTRCHERYSPHVAVSSAYWFDYEVVLAADDQGQLSGKSTNLQASSGALPGLAGSNPTVTVCGDVLVVDSRPSDRPPSRLWDYITLFIPFAHGAYIDRCQRAAHVRGFELELPGLSERVRPGYTIRFTRAILAGPGRLTETPCEVTLRDGSTVLHTWSNPALSEQSWSD
jgi:hypothetical protein